MAQNGFRMDGTPHEKVLDKGVVSKLEEIMKPENLPRVQECARGARGNLTISEAFGCGPG
jgi:hypothetical protein